MEEELNELDISDLVQDEMDNESSSNKDLGDSIQLNLSKKD